MMASMAKGTRAAGGGRRRAASDPVPAQAPQTPRAPDPRDQQAGPGTRRQAPPPAQPPAPARAQPGGGRPRSGRGATFSVVMMTLIALAGVGVLAAQAEATAPKVRSQTAEAASSKGSSSKPGSGTSVSADALPANSGHGTRIVYSLPEHRVWLVSGSTVERTMQVVPGTRPAPTGTFTVYGKSPGSLGGDGVTVIYVVSFDSNAPDTYGFDAEADVTGLPPAPKGSTGGVRMTQLDAEALYKFASVGTTVVVL